MSKPDLDKYKTLKDNTLLEQYVHYVVDQIADVRTPLNVDPELEIHVRKATCEVIQYYFQTKLSQLDQDVLSGVDNWS